jgi:hypothetical protein
MGMDVNCRISLVELIDLVDTKNVWYGGELKKRLLQMIANKMRIKESQECQLKVG